MKINNTSALIPSLRVNLAEIITSNRLNLPFLDNYMGLPWWLRWESICLQCRRLGFNSWVWKISWKREWQPTPVFLPGEFHGQRSLHTQKQSLYLWYSAPKVTLTLKILTSHLLFFLSVGLPCSGLWLVIDQEQDSSDKKMYLPHPIPSPSPHQEPRKSGVGHSSAINCCLCEIGWIMTPRIPTKVHILFPEVCDHVPYQQKGLCRCDEIKDVEVDRLSQIISICCLVTLDNKSCPALCVRMGCSTPGFSVLHYPPEFAQIHVHWVGHCHLNISSSAAPFSFWLQSFSASGSFPLSQLFSRPGVIRRFFKRRKTWAGSRGRRDHVGKGMWSESRSVMSDSLWPHGLYSPWNSPGQNTGVGSLSLLQGIFPTQGSNLGLPHCRRILYQLS